MRIIVDGNDGVGKTTLAKKLQAEFNIKSYVHLSYSDPRDFEFYYNILRKDNVIFDRSFMDEPIYAFVLNRKPEIDLADEVELYDLVSDLGYIVIICHTDKKLNKGDEFKSIIENEELIDNYFKDASNTPGFIYFDPLNDNYDQLVNLIRFKETVQMGCDDE